MIRYERTGEFRAPHDGEWFEGERVAPAIVTPGTEVVSHHWILRRLDSPAAEPASERPGTEELLSYLTHEHDMWDESGDCTQKRIYRELIRRVRACEKAREYVNKGGTVECGMKIENVVELLAILDAPSQP